MLLFQINSNVIKDTCSISVISRLDEVLVSVGAVLTRTLTQLKTHESKPYLHTNPAILKAVTVQNADVMWPTVIEVVCMKSCRSAIMKTSLLLLSSASSRRTSASSAASQWRLVDLVTQRQFVPFFALDWSIFFPPRLNLYGTSTGSDSVISGPRGN